MPLPQVVAVADLSPASLAGLLPGDEIRSMNGQVPRDVIECATARSRLSETASALRAALDVPSRAKESFQRHRPTWLGGAALLGLVLSKLPSRRSTVFVERATGKALGAAGKLGFAWTAAKFAFDLEVRALGQRLRIVGQLSPGDGTMPFGVGDVFAGLLVLV